MRHTNTIAARGRADGSFWPPSRPAGGVFLLAALLCVVTLPVNSQSVPSARSSSIVPILYEVEFRGARAFLYGSMHLADEYAIPPPRPVREAFSASDVLVTEVPIGDVPGGELALQMATLAMRPLDRSLSDLLNEQERAIVSEWLEGFGLTIEIAEEMAPWGLRLLLTSMNTGGLSAENGLDLYFNEKAVARGMDRDALETVEEQLACFQGAPLQDQAALLLYSIQEPDDGTAVEAIYDAWSAGDEDRMARILTEEYGHLPALRGEYDRLFTQRNDRFAERILTMMSTRTGSTPFIVVGAGHLCGDDSVQDHLAELGATARRLR